MSEVTFNNEDDVINYLHLMCLNGEIKKFHLFNIIRGNFFTLQEVDTSSIKDMFAFSYKKRHEGCILLFLESLEIGFEFRFFTKNLNIEYILDKHGNVSFQSFDNYECDVAFPVDTKAIAESFELIKNYFLGKLKSD